MIRRIARSLAERVLGSPTVLRRSLGRRSGQVLIFAWHNIVPRGEAPAGERTLHTDQLAFGEQLDIITDALPVIRLRDLLGGAGPPDDPAAILTFDDAYLGALSAGHEELARRGLTATVFVAPAFQGGATFWWDAYADPETGRLPDDLRERALTEWAGADDRVRVGLEGIQRKPTPLPGHARFAGCDVLQSVTDAGVFEVASHSWSHPSFDAIDAPERAEQLLRARDWLTSRFDEVVPAFALPYGRGAAVAAEAQGHGCRAALRVEGGWATPSAAPFQVLPRFNVPRGLTPGGLRLRIAGFRS